MSLQLKQLQSAGGSKVYHLHEVCLVFTDGVLIAAAELLLTV